MTESERLDLIQRAICRECCAFMGEPPCFEIRDDQDRDLPWPNDNCDEPGCHALALAVHFTLIDAAKR